MNNPKHDFRQADPAGYPLALHDEAHDEISLIDLAKILLKRRQAILVIFILSLLLGSLLALLKPVTYEYTTLISIGQLAGKPIEPPSGIQNQLERIYLPKAMEKQAGKEGAAPADFQLKTSTPKGTPQVMLISQARSADSQQVKRLHQMVLTPILQRHDKRYRDWKENLETQIETLSDRLDRGGMQHSASELLAVQKVVALEQQLANASPSSAVAYAQQSRETSGTSPKLIIALAAILGLMLAVMGAFMLEFASNVRSALAEETGRAK